MVYFEWKTEVNIVYFLKKDCIRLCSHLARGYKFSSTTLNREIVFMQDFAVQLGFQKLTLSEGKDSLTI